MSRQVRCPRCRQNVLYEGNSHRPFCSERCRKMDLGLWATAGYVISGEDLNFEVLNEAVDSKEICGDSLRLDK